jgi:8-oxo-dGTP diphosphatase
MKHPHGVINQSHINRKDDYLYRISIKCLIRNHEGNILVVKESGRPYWDLPGGGMDHGEDIKAAIARELNEEVGLESDFEYHIIAVEDPAYLPNAQVLQVRLIFSVSPSILPSRPGEEGDELLYIDPKTVEGSSHQPEKRVYQYSLL